MLAKHARALRWDRITGIIVSCIFGLLLWCESVPAPVAHLDTSVLYRLQLSAAFLFAFVGQSTGAHRIYGSQVATLKEIKQVQLQVLELQASLKTGRREV